MKKLTRILCLVVAICLPVLFMPMFAVHSARALDTKEAITASAKMYLESFACHGIYPKQTVSRIAGTDGEAYAGYYIKGELESLYTNVEAANRETVIDGKQDFYYDSARTGKRTKSFNVIYTIKGASSDKKVVLSCNYDNFFEPYLKQEDCIIASGEAYSEGVNASAASVAMLLGVAKNVMSGTLNYDIELVFFGAGYDGNAGANYYLQTMGKAEREKNLLLVDISRIAFGDDVYYYSGEFGSKHENAYAQTGLTKFSSGFAGASVDDNNTLGYYNAGYSGATMLFADTGLNFLHIFAGSYSSGMFGGICEYYGKQNVLNTEKDNLDYISSTALETNLKKVASGINSLLIQPNLEKELSSTDGTFWKDFFANRSIVPYITLVVLLVLLLISVIVHYSITKKTFDYVTKNNISAVMITMEDEDDKNE